MKKFKWYTGPIGAMKEIQIEVSPNTTPDDLRAIDKGLCEGIIKRREYYKGICEQMAAVDYGGSYKAWLKEQLEKHGKIMWMANSEALMAYMAANEYRKICLAELARLEHPTPDTAAGKTYKSSRDEEELTAIFNALTGKTNPKDKKAVFLPADSDLQGWLWICTDTLGKQPKEPLKWLGTPTELALMVDKLFGHKWAVTLTWFRYKSDVDGQWKQPTNTFLSKQCKNSTIDFTELGKVLRPFCHDIKA